MATKSVQAVRLRVQLDAFAEFLSDPSLNQNRSVVRKGSETHLVVHHGLQPQKLLRDANAALGRFSLSNLAIWAVGILVAVLFGAAILVFLSLLDIFSDQFKVLAYEFALPSEPIKRIYLFALLLIGAIIFSFLPSIASTSGAGVGRSVLRRLVSNSERSLSRVMRRSALRKKLHVWNPFGFSADHLRRFLELVVSRRGDVVLYLHHDELAEWTAFAAERRLKWELAETETSERKAASDWRSAWRASTETRSALSIERAANGVRRLSGPGDATLLGFVFLTSTRGASERWREALSTGAGIENGLVARSYAVAAAHDGLSPGGASDLSENERMRRVFERAERDYGVIRPLGVAGAFVIDARLDWPEGKTPSAWRQIERVTRGRIEVAPRSLDTSAAALCALVRWDEAEFFAPMFGRLIERLVACAVAEGDMTAIGVLGDALAPQSAISRGEGEAAGQAGVRLILGGVDLERLSQLGDLLEGAGHFFAALGVYGWIREVDPIESHIRTARLYERVGDFERALNHLLGRYRGEMETLLEGGSRSMQEQPRMAALAARYHMQWAWILYSGALDGPERGPNTALELLRRVAPLLDDARSEALKPMDRWRYWNYLGLIEEWRGAYDKAAQLHYRAADLPGVSLRWIGGSYINAGVALRRSALSQQPQADTLRRAREAVMRGAEIKLGRGDRDEGALALHNAAYIDLCLGRIEPETRVQTAAEAEELSAIGLEILARTKSNKKQALLAAENAFAHLILWASDSAPERKTAVSARADLIEALASSDAVSEADVADVLALQAILFGERSEDLAGLVQELRAI